MILVARGYVKNINFCKSTVESYSGLGGDKPTIRLNVTHTATRLKHADSLPIGLPTNTVSMRTETMIPFLAGGIYVQCL